MIVTLTTDFGTCDGYVGAVKGVILSRAPDVRLVDLSHEVAPGDIFGAAFLLAQAAPYYPPGTVHLVVVDPGVGTAREAIAMACDDAFFVGPNNGVLSLAAPAPRAVYEITAPSFMRSEVSSTFHGRDVFAPAAAQLARGVALVKAGPPLAADRLIRLSVRDSDDELHGRILRVDRFGNAVTSLTCECKAVVVAGCTIPLFRTYEDVGPGELLAYRGSDGWLEIGMREGNAAQALGLTVHTPVEALVEGP